MKWRSRTRYEPLSMIPANGWQAVYATRSDSDAEKGAVFAHAIPLVAFVLTRVTETRVYEDGTEEVTGDFRAIVGYDAHDGSIDPVEKTSNLISYLPPGRPIPDWMEQQARGRVEDEAKRG